MAKTERRFLVVIQNGPVYQEGAFAFVNRMPMKWSEAKENAEYLRRTVKEGRVFIAEVRAEAELPTIPVGIKLDPEF